MKYRQVIWTLPKELVEAVEKQKAESQKRMEIPSDVSTDMFVSFLLDRVLKLYQEANKPKSLIVDPFEYKGARTPR